MRRLIVTCIASCSTLATAANAAAPQPPYVLAYATRSSTNTAAIYAVRADGTDRRQLTAGAGLDIPGTWSPDGSRLAYEEVDATGIYTSIYTVGLDGAPAVGLPGDGYSENPSWSPDGRWLAYQEQTDYGSGGGRADTTFDLYVSRPDGSGRARLGSGGVDGSSADWVGQGLGWDWSPDAKRIAFVQPDPGRTDPGSGDSLERLAVADLTTGRVVAHAGPLLTPEVSSGWAWSPDGRRLGFVRDDGVRIAVLDVARRGVIANLPVAGATVLFAGDHVALSQSGVGWDWSPDGRSLGIVQSYPSHRDPHTGHVPLRLAVVDARTEATWLIPGEVSTRAWGDWSLATADTGWIWSPDGTRLALLRAVPGSPVATALVADTRSRTVRVVGRATEVAWSPDGRVLALATSGLAASCRALRIVDAANGKASFVAPHTPSTCDDALAWSPDGSTLAFTRTDGPTQTVFTVARDGSRLRQVTSALPADSLQWPTQCRRFFSYGDSWIISDAAGAPHAVGHPSWGDATWTAPRCW